MVQINNLLEWATLPKILNDIRFIDINDEIVCIEWDLFHRRGLSRHLGRKIEYPWVMCNSDLQPSDTVLDAGSGISLLQFFLSRRCRKVVSYNHPGMVPEFQSFADMAKNVFTNVDFRGGDLKQINYPGNYFDKVYCISVVEHAQFEERFVIVKELFRVLKPGGILLLTIDVPVTLKQRDDDHTDLICSAEATMLSRECEKYCGEIPSISSMQPDAASLPFLFEDRGKECIIICMRLIKK